MSHGVELCEGLLMKRNSEDGVERSRTYELDKTEPLHDITSTNRAEPPPSICEIVHLSSPYTQLARTLSLYYSPSFLPFYHVSV